MVTTIQLSEEVKRRLEALKVHKREPFNDVIEQLLNGRASQKLASNDIETLKNIAIPILKACPAEQLCRAFRLGHGVCR